MAKCKKCGLEFSEPVIEIHENICKVDKKSKNKGNKESKLVEKPVEEAGDMVEKPVEE